VRHLEPDAWGLSSMQRIYIMGITDLNDAQRVEDYDAVVLNAMTRGCTCS
jgi:hypothetical protein